MVRTPEDEFVRARLDAVAPTWTPDEAQARLRVSAATSSLARPWRRHGLAVGAAAGLLALAMAAPVRTIGQELWYRFAVSRVEVVRLDFANVPLDTRIRTDGVFARGLTIPQAAQLAGFVPRLPSSDVVSDQATLSVTGPIALTQRVRTTDLREALARVGASDLDVPDAWDGVQLEASIGPLVIADYPSDVSIVQAAPVQLRVPAEIPLARVAEVVFRAAGSSWWEARLLGEAYAESPAWLLEAPKDGQATVETLPMPDGAPLVIVDEYGDGGLRSTVLVSRPGRMLAVSSPSRETSLRVAQALLH